jgi:hypothetical protein
MEAARSPETSVDNYFTRQYIPEDKSELEFLRLNPDIGCDNPVPGRLSCELGL